MVESTSTVKLELVRQISVGLEITGGSCSIGLVDKFVKVGNVSRVMLVVMQIKLVLTHDRFKGIYGVGKRVLCHVGSTIFALNCCRCDCSE